MAIPAKVGRYRITGELGRGAMGAVYRAHDPQLDRPVAIKMISASATGGSLRADESEARFLREARVAARLAHPNIVAVFDAGREGNDLYLVMELVEGESLAARLASGRYPSSAETFEIVAQAAEALAVAHAAGVVHRDIKPANLLIGRDGRVKVSDFGVAKAVGEATELTRTGTLVGSPAYMAPEQIKGHELDGRADLFSLGVVLYELLLRRKPFPADTVTTLVYQILHEDPLADPALSTSLPPDQAALLRLCLAKEVGARVADGRVLAARCRALAAVPSPDESPTRVLPAFVAPPPPPLPGPPPLPPAVSPPATSPALASASLPASAPRRGWLWVVGAVAVAVGIGLAALVLRSPSVPPAPGTTSLVVTPPPVAAETLPAPVGTPFGLPESMATPTATPEPTLELKLPTFAPRPTEAPTAAPPPEVATPEPPPVAPPPEVATPGPQIAEVYRCQIAAEFHIDPEEARVSIDGRDIGTSDDWDDTGGGKQWRFDTTGRHLASLSLAGYQTVWIELATDLGAEDEVCNVDLELKKVKRR